MTWLPKSGMTLRRLRLSVNGNPRFKVTFADGTTFTTKTDASVANRIENSDYADNVEIEVDGAGDIVNIRAAARPLHKIAADIRAHWPKVYFGAEPYVEAMASLNSINDMYGADDARYIVNYFLSNAFTWRGPDARRIKTELKALLAERK